MNLTAGLLGLVLIASAPPPPALPAAPFEEEEVPEQDELEDVPEQLEDKPEQLEDKPEQLEDKPEQLEDKPEQLDASEELEEPVYDDFPGDNYADEYIDRSLELGAFPSLRLDNGARIPIASTTPIQYSMRLQAGADLMWRGDGLGVGLQPSVAYRYDHTPSRTGVSRRHLAELGASLALLPIAPLSLGYRGVLVVGTAAPHAGKDTVLGLRHGLELGVAYELTMGVVGLSFTHEVLWQPQPEHALAVTAWLDIVQLGIGITALIALFAYVG